MSVTKNRESATATVSFDVDGEESATPILFAEDYTYRGQKIYPVHVVAEWRRQDGDTWKLERVRVHGDVQTKKGARGKSDGLRAAWLKSWSTDAHWSDDTPDWLKSAVMDNAPA
jgi:hypothetical protein